MAATALVTGGSSGIGLALARLLARDGYRILLAARNQSQLTSAADELSRQHTVEVLTFAVDLSTTSGAADLWGMVSREVGEVEILVNNAGFGTFGRFADSDPQTELDEIQCNITALTYLTRVALQPMLARGHGRIMNVASTAGFQPGPLMAVYYASKAYVLHFSEAVAAEIDGSGVTITTLCPGPVRTGFQSRAKLPPVTAISGIWVKDVDTVARIGYDAMCRGQRMVIPGFFNRLLAWGSRLATRKMVTDMVYRLQKKRAKHTG